MNSTSAAPRITPKSFRYRTALRRLEGRVGELTSDGKPSLRVAAPPEFHGQSGLWTPEDLFVAAVEVCLMLTFVGIAEKRGLSFASYESQAEGRLEWKQGSYRFVRVVISPTVAFFDEHSTAAGREVMERTHDTCLVARSLNCEVIVEPSFVVRH